MVYNEGITGNQNHLVRAFSVLLCLVGFAWAEASVDTSVRFRIVDRATRQGFTGTADAVWHFTPAGYGRYRIVNLRSGTVLGALGKLSAETGGLSDVWEVVNAEGGGCRLKNAGDGQFLGAVWEMAAAGPAYPTPIPVATEGPVHDPSLIKTTGGTYYLFGTHGGIQIQSSADRMHFVRAGQVFATPPAWVSSYTHGDLWAPDVSYHDGKYQLYFAASSFGKNTSAIGLATSPTAAPGSWTDQGIVVSSQSENDYNAIDPGLFIDPSGTWWLSFGSFWNGIFLIQIDPTTGKWASSNHEMYPLARRKTAKAIEAAYIYAHAGYHYLFVSFDQCCAGIRSAYHIVVGRSRDVKGPYYDRAGTAMSDGGGTILLSTHGDVVGPGGQVVVHDVEGDLLVYHYYDGNNNGRPRLGLNLLGWDADGWPYVKGAEPVAR